MNVLNRQDLADRIKSQAAKQNLSQMVDSLGVYTDTLRRHISQGAGHLGERREAIEKEIESSKIMIEQILKRLESLDNSVSQTIIHYSAIDIEVKKEDNNAEDR